MVAIGGLAFFSWNNSQTPTSTKSTSQSGTGQAPIWHTFDNVFSASCNPDNCGYNIPVSSDCELGGAILTCSYEGASYLGSYSTYCNTSPNGVIPTVNEVLVPYLGCELSRAPITHLFSDLYTLSGSGSSMTMWGPSSNQVTVFPTQNYQLDACSYPTGLWSNMLTCSYLGMVYSGVTSDVCNLGTPIQVNGEPVPAGACMLQRN